MFVVTTQNAMQSRMQQCVTVKLVQQVIHTLDAFLFSTVALIPNVKQAQHVTMEFAYRFVQVPGNVSVISCVFPMFVNLHAIQTALALISNTV